MFVFFPENANGMADSVDFGQTTFRNSLIWKNTVDKHYYLAEQVFEILER